MADDPFRAAASVFARWWFGMTDAAHDGANADRKGLAELRRIGLVDIEGIPTPDVVTALEIEGYRRLLREMAPLVPLGRDDLEIGVAIAAATLARVRRNKPTPARTATALGGLDAEARVMKEGRFLRLMRAETAGDLFEQARRLVLLLGGEAPAGELGASLLFWRHWPSVRRNWARAYYALDQTNKEGAGLADEPAQGALP